MHARRAQDEARFDHRAVRLGPSSADLPAGQRGIATFPRYGVHLADPPPAIHEPRLGVTGAVSEPFTLESNDLHALPRVERVTEFHCVAGWSARGLRWQGVSLPTLWERYVVARAHPEATHLLAVGADGYSASLDLRDVLHDDVLVADVLDGAPLPADHGAPLRIVSPRQYGYKSVKHLVELRVCIGEPRDGHTRRSSRFLLALVRTHPRARVDHCERHRYLPPAVVGPLYRAIHLPIAYLSMRGGR